MDKIPKDEETESISISHMGVQAIQIHNRFYDFNPTMRRLLKEIAKEPAPSQSLPTVFALLNRNHRIYYGFVMPEHPICG